MEQHLNDLVGVPQEDGLLGSLPLLDVAEVLEVGFTLGCLLLAERELKGLEFLIAVKVALEVLQEDNLLVDGLRVVEEVEVTDLVADGLKGLAAGGARRILCLLWPLDVVEMELVRVQDDLRGIVEVNTIRAV